MIVGSPRRSSTPHPHRRSFENRAFGNVQIQKVHIVLGVRKSEGHDCGARPWWPVQKMRISFEAFGNRRAPNAESRQWWPVHVGRGGLYISAVGGSLQTKGGGRRICPRGSGCGTPPRRGAKALLKATISIGHHHVSGALSKPAGRNARVWDLMGDDLICVIHCTPTAVGGIMGSKP